MSETLESYCEYYKRPCTVSDGLCSECGERLIEPASGATEESPKTKGMTNGKQRVRVIIEQLVKENGAELMQDRLTHPSIDQALDSIEEVVLSLVPPKADAQEIWDRKKDIGMPVSDALMMADAYNECRTNTLGRWESK